MATDRQTDPNALDLRPAFRHITRDLPEAWPMYFLKRMLTWWNSQTLGTQIWTWRRGSRVGEDALGNIYYVQPGTTRRWVIYNGEAEASRVPPEWHGWLHHTLDHPPSEMALPAKAWQIAPQENLTGTDAAYAPPGSIRNAAPAVRRDYEAWQPE